MTGSEYSRQSSFAAMFPFLRYQQLPPDEAQLFADFQKHFAARASASLANLLNTKISISLDSIEQSSFSRFQLSLVSPTCLCTFGFPDNQAQAFLDLNASLAFTAIHRLLGGTTDVSVELHNFSNLEMALNRKVLTALLRDLSDECKNCHKSVVLKKIFSSHVLAKKEAVEELYIVARHKAVFGVNTGILSVAIPVSMFQAFLFPVDRVKVEKTQHKADSVDLNDLEVSVKGLLGDIVIHREELTKLEPGDIIDLGKSISEPIEVLVDEDALLQAKPGLIGIHRGLQIKGQL